MAAKSRTMAQQKTKEAYCFIVPAFIYMILVLGYPIVYNIILSLKDVNVKNLKSGTSVFVGLQNYIELFHDPTFLLVLRNTFIFTIACLIFQFTIGFAFAMFFNQKFKLAGPIRGLILVSYMMPMAVTGLLGKNIFSNAGLINDLLGKIGISGPEWLVNTSTALIAVIVMNCWVGIPFNMLLLVSGLTSISPDVYESASMDGANWGQRFHLYHTSTDEGVNSRSIDVRIHLYVSCIRPDVYHDSRRSVEFNRCTGNIFLYVIIHTV